VQPLSRVGYVPTAALLVRRSALVDGRGRPAAFDADLRYGEDVDLIWRLDAVGWRIRYDPSVVVTHRESHLWRDRVIRRFRYGTSAAPLSQRHPEAIAPLVVAPWPALTVLAVATGRHRAAVLAGAATVRAGQRAVRRANLPPGAIPRPAASSVAASWTGIGRYATQFAVPILLAGLHRGRVERPARTWWRRAATIGLLAAPPISSWRARQPAVDPVRFGIGHFVDDVAYGAGVIAGCVRRHTTTPLRPTMVSRPSKQVT
ncbi:MAG TPA: mycofactocin system glycosyltransferase, partial [Micromonosporaceae bacterium]